MVVNTGNNETNEIVEHGNNMDGVINLIEQVVYKPEIDIDKLDRLFNMQISLLERQSLVEYNKAMALAQSEIPPVARDERNKHTASDYATMQAVIEAITPTITKYGFSVEFGQGESVKDDLLRITYDIRHSGGHVVSKYVDVPTDQKGIGGKVNKTNTHAFGSTFSYGRRYALMLIFNIATRDDDGNNEPVDYLNGEQIAVLRGLLDTKKCIESGFYANFKCTNLSDFPADKFGYAVKVMEAKDDK